MIQTDENGQKLLYLGFAFPPGVQALYPGINPAGHALETQMMGELRKYYEVRSVGLLPLEPPQLQGADPASGIAHDLLLVERPPELWHRLRSVVRLKQQYRRWLSDGWSPDLVLVYNLSPVYNQFLLWIKQHSRHPKLVLLLLDSPNLGQKLPWLKRTRRRFKPMFVPDDKMITRFDACVALSRPTEQYFAPAGVPFLWMPGGCSPNRALAKPIVSRGNSREPVRFGYYGSLGAHAGVKQLVRTFLNAGLNATLELCGYGKASDELAEIARHEEKVKFLGLLTPEECLRFGEQCDVLINPRPATHGNQNNFASKLFDYALSGSAILTSRLSGVESVLGPDAYYFDAEQFDATLSEQLRGLAATPRAELARRGAAVQRKVLGEFSWAEQGRRLAEFMQRLVTPHPAEPASAELAA